MSLQDVVDLNSLPPPEPARIKKSRELVRLSQREAALAIGQSKRSWQHYEWGTRTMSAAKFMQFLLATADRREPVHASSVTLQEILASPEHQKWVAERTASG